MTGLLAMGKQRKVRLIACALGLTLAFTIFGLVTFAPATPVPGVTRENFERIEFGMNVDDLDEFLGPPSPLVQGDGHFIEVDGELSKCKSWISEDWNQILVRYTDGGGIFEKTWAPKGGPTVSEFRGQQNELQKTIAWLRAVLGRAR